MAFSRDQLSRKAKAFWPGIREKVLVPFLMVIVGIVLFQPIERWWTGEDKYIIYLVGNKNDGETQRIFRSVQQEAALAKLRFDGREIEVEEEDDKGLLETALAKAKEIVADPRTLFVIGHVSGDITMQTLPVYLKAASPKVPVITTRESTPKLLSLIPECTQERNYCPLVPLSPTDDAQAEDMLNFAKRQNKHSFMILQENETSHRTYSDYLASRLKEDIRERQSESLVSTDQILDQVSFSQLIDKLNRYSPDCLFYIGGPVTILKLEAFLDDAIKSGQLKSTFHPMLIVSDGAVSEALISNHFDSPIYVTYQLSSREYIQSNHVYGTDAFAVIDQLISQAGGKLDLHRLGVGAALRHLVNMHRTGDARETLTKIMEDNAHYSTPYVGRNDRTYSYYGRYARLNAHFHIWKIENQAIVEADEQDGRG